MATRSDNKMRRKYIPSLILPLFIFILLAGLNAEDIQCVWTDVERIVAVGDLHGDYKHFVKILKINNIVEEITDDNFRWIAGKTHLVQIGDVMDRGKEAKKILKLLKDLEIQAEEAGGKVHVLIGNHEELNIVNRSFETDLYVTVEQFIAFIPDEYRQKREKRIRRKIGDIDSENTNSDSSLHPELQIFWDNILKNAKINRNSEAQNQYYKGFINKYGKWILQHNAVIKINNTVFVHGGISEKYSVIPLKDINDRLRDELEAYRIAILRGKYPVGEDDIVFDQNGPLWYRDLATADEKYFEETVDKILNNLDAEHIVSGHTRTRIRSNAYRGRFHEKVWIIDTSISSVYPRGSLSALTIKNFGKKNSDFELWVVPHNENNTSIDNILRALWNIWSGYITSINTFFFDGIVLIIKNNDYSLWG